MLVWKVVFGYISFALKNSDPNARHSDLLIKLSKSDPSERCFRALCECRFPSAVRQTSSNHLELELFTELIAAFADTLSASPSEHTGPHREPN